MPGEITTFGTFALPALVGGLLLGALTVAKRDRSRLPHRETGLESYVPAEMAFAGYGVDHEGEAVQADPDTDVGDGAAGREARHGGRRGGISADRLSDRDIAHRREAQ